LLKLNEYYQISGDSREDLEKRGVVDGEESVGGELQILLDALGEELVDEVLELLALSVDPGQDLGRTIRFGGQAVACTADHGHGDGLGQTRMLRFRQL